MSTLTSSRRGARISTLIRDMGAYTNAEDGSKEVLQQSMTPKQEEEPRGGRTTEVSANRRSQRGQQRSTGAAAGQVFSETMPQVWVDEAAVEKPPEAPDVDIEACEAQPGKDVRGFGNMRALRRDPGNADEPG